MLLFENYLYIVYLSCQSLYIDQEGLYPTSYFPVCFHLPVGFRVLLLDTISQVCDIFTYCTISENRLLSSLIVKDFNSQVTGELFCNQANIFAFK